MSFQEFYENEQRKKADRISRIQASYKRIAIEILCYIAIGITCILFGWILTGMAFIAYAIYGSLVWTGEKHRHRHLEETIK